jgi:DNA invertase Pin-like site-specific DNA recombinase
MTKKSKAVEQRTTVVKAYLRVSTGRQTIENQRFEILNFAEKKGLIINEFVCDTASGTIHYAERKLGSMVDGMGRGDTLIVSELSRMGRSLFHIMTLLNQCMEKEMIVFAVKEGYELGNSLMSKVLAFAFSLSAEIERNLISQRTKEALARKRAEGVILGRRKGKTSALETRKVHKHVPLLKHLYVNLNSKSEIARQLGVHRTTVSTYMDEFKISHMSIMEEHKDEIEKILRCKNVYLCHLDIAKMLKVSPHVLRIFLAEREKTQSEININRKA